MNDEKKELVEELMTADMMTRAAVTLADDGHFRDCEAVMIALIQHTVKASRLMIGIRQGTKDKGNEEA